MLEDVLWHLGRLAASSVARDDDDSISVKFLQNLISMLGNREILCIFDALPEVDLILQAQSWLDVWIHSLPLVLISIVCKRVILS